MFFILFWMLKSGDVKCLDCFQSKSDPWVSTWLSSLPSSHLYLRGGCDSHREPLTSLWAIILSAINSHNIIHIVEQTEWVVVWKWNITSFHSHERGKRTSMLSCYNVFMFFLVSKYVVLPWNVAQFPSTFSLSIILSVADQSWITFIQLTTHNTLVQHNRSIRRRQRKMATVWLSSIIRLDNFLNTCSSPQDL